MGKYSKGDKIICKKEVSFSNIKYYTVGESATIISIWNDTFLNNVVFLTCKIRNVHGSYEFGFETKEIKKHFYTLKQIRKQKLEKINESIVHK